jgi:hypothetical protein
MNLVQAGLDQVKRIPGVDATSVDIKKCNNPTFSSDGSNTLAKNAPQPAACDKQGAEQCTIATGGAPGSVATGGTSDGSSSGSSSGGSSGSGASGSTAGGTGTTGSLANTGGGGAVGGGPVSCEADTGVCTNVVALPIEVAGSSSWGIQQTLMLSAVLVFLGLVIVPPLIGSSMNRKKAQR